MDTITNRFALIAWLCLAGAACASAADDPHGSPDAAPMPDAGTTIDSGGPSALDAAPLLPALFAPCDTSTPCNAGLTCYALHTAPSWGAYDGGDAFEHCVIVGTCFGTDSFRCNALDGTCTCPFLPDGTPEWCHGDQDGGIDVADAGDLRANLICVPIPH